MREPSLHITHKNLVLVLLKLDISSSKQQAKILATSILSTSKHYSINSRIAINLHAKNRKRVEKLMYSERVDAELMSKLLLLIRRQNKQRGISIIKAGSRDWGMIKEITKLAIEFCNDFKLEKNQGFKDYINMALPKMKRFSLMKFNNLHNSICETYEAELEIRADTTPQETLDAFNIYQRLMMENFALEIDYREYPDKYKYFIHVKRDCSKMKIDVNSYIKAQFDAFMDQGRFPDPAQLVGIKSKERLNRFNTLTPQTKKRDWSFLKPITSDE